ncbi:MAG: hypothetical protein H8E12_15430 [Rhodobacteraceae bacterium]|nr:hypothetical protein [Paracoccaceae bacterium]
MTTEEILNEIYRYIEHTPNDMELGRKIRHFMDVVTELKEETIKSE